MAETLAVFPPLRQRIADAVQKLEDQLEASGQEKGAVGGPVPDEEIMRAKEGLVIAKNVIGEGA
jgi:tubulin-specific chaperone A